MALFSFQSGNKAAKSASFFCQSGNEAVKNGSSLLGLKAAVKRLKVVLFDVFKEGRNWREIFPVKQGKYRKKQGISFKF